MVGGLLLMRCLLFPLLDVRRCCCNSRRDPGGALTTSAASQGHRGREPKTKKGGSMKVAPKAPGTCRQHPNQAVSVGMYDVAYPHGCGRHTRGSAAWGIICLALELGRPNHQLSGHLPCGPADPRQVMTRPDRGPTRSTGTLPLSMLQATDGSRLARANMATAGSSSPSLHQCRDTLTTHYPKAGGHSTVLPSSATGTACSGPQPQPIAEGLPAPHSHLHSPTGMAGLQCAACPKMAHGALLPPALSCVFSPSWGHSYDFWPATAVVEFLAAIAFAGCVDVCSVERMMSDLDMRGTSPTECLP
ncbi:hypothetical protein NDU88_001959 [Pleurodeles waltl]|uniref:Uncharacterized protein n=1 Tax=Pleurodeles waltl TaxID=8319 RepID=A0AAV7T1Z1_PLEWA|nr:hypothetical protein NDU88_001959 [Pleurodeles waltl]